MVLVLCIVKATLEILGIGIGVKKVVLLRSGLYYPEVQIRPLFLVTQKHWVTWITPKAVSNGFLIESKHVRAPLTSIFFINHMLKEFMQQPFTKLKNNTQCVFFYSYLRHSHFQLLRRVWRGTCMSNLPQWPHFRKYQPS